jgi:GxxExxY protein
LKEDAYENALCEALSNKGITFERQRTVPVEYEGVRVAKFRPDLVVENTVVVEVKSVDRLSPLFTAQVIAHLKVTNLRVGLLLNFNCPRMADGIKRVVF